MAPLATAEDFCPAPLFMRSASRTMPATQRFMLDGLVRTLRAGSATVEIPENTIAVIVLRPDDSEAYTLPIYISIDNAALGWEILHAYLANKILLEAFHVSHGGLTQQRLVLLLEVRVVGQLYCSHDGKSLRLEIKERFDAQALGDGVLALGCLSNEGATSVGSAPAGTIH